MQTVLDVLYTYLQEELYGPALWGDPEFRQSHRSRQAREDKLRSLLDGEALNALDAMLEETCRQQCAELAVLFRATLSLCRELDQATAR